MYCIFTVIILYHQHCKYIEKEENENKNCKYICIVLYGVIRFLQYSIFFYI